MERDTTRYVNLTTIATFFSSVTATTMQLTYAGTDAVPSNSLRGIVNFLWFLSLVFSVSSGVSSLLGLTWRKSSMCVFQPSLLYSWTDDGTYSYGARVPPVLIRMWFNKAPMLFLIIAAVAFVIGLNLFAYLSLQVPYRFCYGYFRTDFWSAALCLSRNEYPYWSARHVLARSYALVYRSAQAWFCLGCVDQGGLKIDHGNRRSHYFERHAEDQEGHGMDLDRHKDRHELGQKKAEMYLEHGKVALR